MYPHSDPSMKPPAMSGPVSVGGWSEWALVLLTLLLTVAAVACDDSEPAVPSPTTATATTVKEATAVPTSTATPVVTAKGGHRCADRDWRAGAASA